MQSPTFFESGGAAAVEVIQSQNRLRLIGSFTNMKETLFSWKIH